MYDLQYVKKRRRRKIAAVVSLIASIGVASLVVTSFLGRTVGTFTVAVTNSTVKLALSKTEKLENTTSYLRIEKLLPIRETTYDSLPKDDILDNEETAYDYGTNMDDNGNAESLQYVKYTFYVTNEGTTTAKYNLTVTLADRKKSDDGTERTLDDTLRVMVYENDPIAGTNNEPQIWAKEAKEYNYTKGTESNPDGEKTRREFVSYYPTASNQEDDEHKLVDYSFLPGTDIVKYVVPNFRHHDVRRYTIVIWLEGEDPQSDNSTLFPEGATLRLGVNIKAYENS